MVFVPFYVYSFYFILQCFVLRQTVVIDTNGGENELKKRNILIVLEVIEEDSSTKVIRSFKKLFDQPNNGKTVVVVVTQGANDICNMFQFVSPIETLIVQNTKVLLVECMLNGRNLFYVHFDQQKIENRTEMLNIIRHIISDSYFRYEYLLYTRCFQNVESESLTRMSNTLVANPRIAFVSGFDLVYDGSWFFRKLVLGSIQNRFGKYLFISSSNIVMFNISHPSIIKNGFDSNLNTQLIGYSERTWGVIDTRTIRIDDEVVLNDIFLFDFIELLLNYWNLPLMFMSLVETFIRLTSISRIVFFFMFVFNNYSYEEWMMYGLYTSIGISSLSTIWHVSRMFVTRPVKTMINMMLTLINDLVFKEVLMIYKLLQSK
jgi:hypothetical protein